MMIHLKKKEKVFFKRKEKSFVQFESISYQRINDNISFIKGYVTINEITKNY